MVRSQSNIKSVNSSQNQNQARREKVGMENLVANLPQEIITDILLRVPAKSIAQFRCVSKPWRSLLCSSQFIKAHLFRHTHDQKDLILISPSHSLFTLKFTTATDGVSKKLNLPDYQDNWVSLGGSCNGLVLVVNEENCKILMNPISLEHVKLPNSPLALDPLASFSMNGFGYDSFNEDYKIVTLSYYDTDNEHEPDCAETFVDLYSVKMSSWRRLESSPYDHAVPYLASGVFVNGAIHWLASPTSDFSSVIAAFDLVSEKFNEVPAPSALDKSKFVFNRLVVLGGCLGMVVDKSRDQIDVWMMKEYGVGESWTKFTINGPEHFDDEIPVCLMGDDKVVLEVDGEKLIVYNLTDETYSDILVDGIQALFENGVSFSGSLVSPKRGGGN